MKKLKAGIVAVTGGVLFCTACGARSPRTPQAAQNPDSLAKNPNPEHPLKFQKLMLSDSTVYGKPLSEILKEDSVRSELEMKLKVLAEIPEVIEISLGAMCYEPAIPEIETYTCRVCNTQVADRYDYWTVLDVAAIQSIVDEIRQAGFDVLLDEREFCPACSGQTIDQPELIFRIRFSPSEEYHTVRSNIGNEYRCLHTFLLTRKTVYSAGLDEERALNNQIDILCKMTGLGRDLQIPRE